MEKLCPICNKPTRVYMGNARKDGLCGTHADMLKEGKIILCEKCGKYHAPEEKCKNEKQNEAKEELTCLLCGEKSNGKHFCKSCYYKYKDKSIDIRIKNCTEIEILDKYGNQTILCDDGRKVRSRAEALISNFLFNNKIRAVYERTIYYEENGETKTLHPDFYLPDYEYYIEYNELNKKSYLKKAGYTQKIYEDNKLKVIIMDDKDLEDIAACLKPKLKIM